MSYMLRVITYAWRLHTNPSDWIKIKHFIRSALFLAPPVGLEPTTLRLTAACSTDWAIEEYLCRHYLFSQAASSQVSSAQMSLTTVFGMGTGGPSSQSTPTINWPFKPIICNIIRPYLVQWWPVRDSNSCCRRERPES